MEDHSLLSMLWDRSRMMDQRQMMDSGRMQTYRMDNMFQDRDRMDRMDFRGRQNDMMNRLNGHRSRNQMNRFNKRDADSDVISYRTMMTETPFERSRTEVFQYEDDNMMPRMMMTL